MSPRSSAIKELDGLPAGEIRLLVSDSERRTVDVMEQKFDEHRSLIEQRLDKQDEKLDAVQRPLSALVGTDQVPGLVAGLRDTMDQMVQRYNVSVEQQRMWHEESVAYRQTSEQSRAEILNRVATIEGQVALIRWFVFTSKGLAKVACCLVSLLKRLKAWENIFIAVIMLLIGVLSPKLMQFILHVMHMSWSR